MVEADRLLDDEELIDRVYEAQTAPPLTLNRHLCGMFTEQDADLRLIRKLCDGPLVPNLGPGMTVIMDNASFHKHPDTGAIIKPANCNLLYLPPYSPDLNPIEHDFANLKRRRSLHPETSPDDLVKSYM